MEPPEGIALAPIVSPPERIPTPPAKSASPPVERPTEPDRIPTPLAKSASPPERIPTPPAEKLIESFPERPDTPLEMVNPSLLMTGAEVEVTSRLPTPPLITRWDKSTQTDSPSLHVKRLELGNRLLERQQLLSIKDSSTNRRLQFNRLLPKTLFCGCPTIILF
ncbi:hypothetical protein TNCT_24881 [Trichonephila clavata]|uniref:Uncharacterized protein n=1 Tax=Trichonephila clavata TaxID=2740835 RepID=A0A8X6IAR1_TRICU|nr:hypothetical protein TNCT_24881 [Trichonephila clavata]